ncbi:MAG: hypothetical protein ACOYPR_09610 [Saprospiraceae bacterium]
MKVLERFLETVWAWLWHILAFIGILLFCGHLWFVNNSEKVLENTIRIGSNGKLNCAVKRFSINYFTNVINVDDIGIFNTDSTAEETSYKLTVHNFHLRIRSKWDLIFNSRLLIDSLIFNHPEIVITRVPKHLKTKSNRKILLVQELGKLYKTINNSLEVLNLDLFEIKEGRLLVKEAGAADKNPLQIDHIYFRVDKISINAENIRDKTRFHFSERIILKVLEQKIVLPDGESTIAFKELLIDTKEKMVRVTAPKLNLLPFKDKNSSLAFEANRVSMLGLDFNSLYVHDLLKIDSFFLESPSVNLDYFKPGKTKSAARKRIEIDTFINRLPIAINIGHIVMQQGGLTIQLHKSGKTTAFSTQNDDIAISNFHLNDPSDHGIRLTGFNYTLRHYVGFSADSTYRFDFDSLQFINNRIILYNLQVTTANKDRAKLLRNYVVPRFEIKEMDWFSFVLENHLIAKEAIMYDPELNLERNKLKEVEPDEQTKKKKSLYEVLSLFDKIIDLEQLQIINGAFNFKQANNLNAHIQNLNMNIYLNDLGKARTPEELVHTFRDLSFDSATVRNTANLLTVSKSVLDIVKQKLAIRNLQYQSDNNNITMALQGVEIQDFLIDTNFLDLSAISWKEGAIHIDDNPKNNEKSYKGNKNADELRINKITGKNTYLYYSDKQLKASVFLSTFSANNFYKEKGKPFQLEDLMFAGNSIRATWPQGNLHGDEFWVQDQQQSGFKNLRFVQNSKTDSLLLEIPDFQFIPDIKQMAHKEAIILDKVQIKQPQFHFTSTLAVGTPKNTTVHLPPFEFANLWIEDAKLAIKLPESTVQLESCTLQAKDLVSTYDSLLYFDALQVQLNKALIQNTDQFQISMPGKAVLQTAYCSYHWNQQRWKIQDLSFAADSLRYLNGAHKKQTRLNLYGLDLMVPGMLLTADMETPMPWLINRSNAQMQLAQVDWRRENMHLQVHQIRFDQKEKWLHLDTFSLNPGKNRDDFFIDTDYKRDFIQLAAGKTDAQGLVLDNGIWHFPAVESDHFSFDLFINKVKKLKVDGAKPMPTGLIKKIPFPLQIDTLLLNDAKVRYTELNAVSKDTGSVYFTDIQGHLNNIQSKPGPAADSLKIDLSTKFLDTFSLKLVLHESNTDTLGGLRMQMQLGRGNLELLNTFLPHLTPIYIKSGMVDSLSMDLIANDFKAQVHTQFYSHNLKVGVALPHPTKFQRRKMRVLNFLANRFGIHHNNSKRSVDVEFSRLRDKSAISYFLKAVLEGVAETVSPFINKLYKRHRLKGLKLSS